MKRVLSILLVTLLAFSAISIMVVNAAEVNASLTVSNASGKVGDTVDVTVSVSGMPKFLGGKFTFIYSKTDLKLKSITPAAALGENLVSLDADKITYDNFESEIPVADGSTVCTAKFEILEGAKTSTVSVSTSEVFTMDLETWDQTDYTFNVTDGTVTVESDAPSAQEQFEAAIAATNNADSNDPLGNTTFKGLEMLGAQQKVGKNDIRFVTVVSKDVLAGAKDYGYIVAQTSKSAEAVGPTIGKMNYANAPHKYSCKGTTNDLGDYGDTNADTNYKYLTAGITNVKAGKTIVARFYVETEFETTYYYATYGNLAGVAYTIAAA